MLTRMRRRLLPRLLLIVGLVGLVGCIYLPAFDHPRTPSGGDPRKLIGEAGSRTTLTVGHATSQSVRAVLGDPDLVANGGRTTAYAYAWPTGRWFGLCAGRGWQPFDLISDPSDQRRFLFLHFAPDGTLDQFQWVQPGNEALPMVNSHEWGDFVARTARL
jgi:hypothetical protein